jgi:galactan endo-1,6-beta-galactosidase
VAGAAPARADYTTSINPAVSWGTWEGWGTSLAWWANALGPRADLADVLFGRNTVQYCGQALPGLGMNIVRYNAGGAGTNSINGRTMQPTPALDGYKLIEGYQLDWFNADPQSASWNWQVDAHQRDMMWLARDRGVNVFELFSNSPMWWMLKNDDPHGAADGGNNLQAGNYGRHAAYLATVARYAHDHWGVDFSSVDPLNEPNSAWSPASGRGQEGCHFDPADQAEILRLTRSQLDARGLGWMQVAGADEWGYDSALWTWNQFDPATRDAIGRVNVHGYDTGGRRDLLYNAVAPTGKKIWNSEYTDGDSSGMSIATNLNLDLRWLHPTAWVYWQVVDSGANWGPIEIVNGEPAKVNTKYFVLAQYMRHIRPGMQIIDGGGPDTVAAYDSVNHKLVVVATNYGTGQWIDFDLSRFSGPYQSGVLVDRWSTETSGAGLYQYHQDTYVHGTRFWSYFAPNSVQTFEVPGVYL